MQRGLRNAFLPLLIVLPSYVVPFDAAVEAFLVDAKKIHPASLKDVIGVFTITFSELNYYIQMEMKPAEIQGFHPGEDYFSENAKRGPVLSVANTKAISGIDYSGMIIRRFPIVKVDYNMIQIIYDVEKNLRAWVQTVDGKYVRTSVGQLVPGESMYFTEGTNMNHSWDVFFLMNGKPRIFYQTPNETAAKIPVINEQSFDVIPWRARKEEVSSFEITEIQNGFAKVNTRQGADGELLFAGWVKIYIDGKLTVWQFATGGC